jgi:tRNA(Ile)-lysidine synthase
MEAIPELSFAIPGEALAPAFNLRLRVDVSAPAPDSGQIAILRNWKPGDRVTLRYSSGPRKVKEVLERMRVTGARRRVWPVLERGGRVIWMKGAELEPEPGVSVVATSLDV